LHDAIQMERLGVPAALLITEPFQEIVDSVSPTLGAESYPTAALPHPVSALGQPELAVLAKSVVDLVSSQLAD
jgi:hypothetical protein